MPRRSAEEIAAIRWRTGSKPPAPPADLPPRSRKLWRQIVSSKPVDFWTPTMRVLLSRFCRTAEYCSRVADALDQLPVGSDQALKLTRQLIGLNGTLSVLSQKMRLSAQNTISARSTGWMAETGGIDNPLIGGHATHDRR
jgi:hypothetical protein